MRPLMRNGLETSYWPPPNIMSSNGSHPTNQDTVLALDLLRGFAAFMVMVSHIVTPPLEKLFGKDLATYPWPWQCVRITLGSGIFWVWGFFVISGFCIHQSIRSALSRCSYSHSHYTLARFTRIYPLYLLGIAVSCGVYAIAVGPVSASQVIGQLFMTQSFTGTLPAFDPSWSLANEALYYALWPIALACSAYQPDRALRWSFILAMVATLLCVMTWKKIGDGDHGHWLMDLRRLIGPYPIWLAGAWLAMTLPRWQSRVTLRSSFLALLGVYALDAGCRVYHAPLIAELLISYITAAAFILFIAASHQLKLASKPRWRALAQRAGLFSYPCYLLHLPVAYGCVYWISEGQLSVLQSTATIFVVTLAIVMTLGVALERVIMAWRQRLLSADTIALAQIS